MMENQLLENLRKMNRALLQADSRLPTLEDGLKAIADVTGSAALLVDTDGLVLAASLGEVKPASRLEPLLSEKSLASDTGYLSMLKKGEVLFNQSHPGDKNGEKELAYHAIVPLSGQEKPAVSLFMYRSGDKFSDEHLILAEAAAMAFGVILKNTAIEKENTETRNRELAEGAFESLSYSEVEAIQEILKNISNNESVVIASKIADRLGITRSVIVNALRKFESAGIIESRSLGMKGTFIRVKNLHALEMVASRSSKMSGLS
jgi:transcriptional pleiotropic repressor